ncbi:hypothetical protein SAMD00023353_3100390 [Rosellinia necatrix]|uniref:Uncharacterized protein n=1 Tax=Rosellinia necatrix TaxID=77044 RepID=A0A1W2TU09_ROSNE|nr:hypothetical protein SAMD00023353_3100390 [Rosellinia necatrix]
MGLFKSASTAGRDRPGPTPRSNIRGKISGPIPIPDDEFPMSGPELGVVQEGTLREPEIVIQRDSIAASASATSNAPRADRTISLAQSGPSQASRTSASVRRRTNRSSTLRYSTVSETTDTAILPQKKSAFRVALGKLFKKRNKKQDSRSTSGSEAQAGPPNDHHHSDPVVREQEPIESESEPKRSASLPITEFNKALRSHSIGPDDYIAIHSARNSLQSDSVFLRRRAATTSGGGALGSRLQNDTIDIAGLSPRPASAQGHDTIDEHDPESIGRAVSVDVLTSHRRSRSLSQLHDISEGQGLVRKRSEEIRYWRASHNLGLLSSDLSISNLEGLGTTETTEPTMEIHEEIQATTPPEPFNFSSISLMRITQAASLEERVAALEVRNKKLEKLVSQLFQVVPGIDNYSDAIGHAASVASTAPPATYAAPSSAVAEMSSRQNIPIDADLLSPGYSISQHSNMSFEDEKTFIGSIHPSTREAARPISNVTIRGATSLPSLPRDGSGSFTPDSYGTLKTLLDAERAARQALEIRVTKLAHIINTMSRTSYKPNLSSVSGPYANMSVFEHDDDDDDITEPPSAGVDSSVVFETPREEQPTPHYEVAGEHIQDEVDDGSRKRAARTLSLGQLTLGKPKYSKRPDTGIDL